MDDVLQGQLTPVAVEELGWHLLGIDLDDPSKATVLAESSRPQLYSFSNRHDHLTKVSELLLLFVGPGEVATVAIPPNEKTNHARNEIAETHVVILLSEC